MSYLVSDFIAVSTTDSAVLIAACVRVHCSLPLFAMLCQVFTSSSMLTLALLS
jgi:hypothetical protein